jgi:hypothetical protein
VKRASKEVYSLTGLFTHLHEGGYVIMSDNDNKNVLFGIDKAVYEKYI